MVTRNSTKVQWVSQSIIRFIKAHAALVIFQPVRFWDKSGDGGQFHCTSHTPDLHSKKAYGNVNVQQATQSLKTRKEVKMQAEAVEAT